MKSAANDKLYLRLRVAMLFILWVVLLGTAAYGQETATIVGTVTDPRARLYQTQKSRLRTWTTDSSVLPRPIAAGNYTAPELPIGNSRVQVEASGFKTYERKDISLNVNDTVRVDAHSRLGL